LLIKALGVQAGVVEAEDYKVSAGSGLQVNVKKGKAFVEETEAIEESENSFYNGMYLVPNPTETNPYNSVEVSVANPQIAQIILRVYDIGVLKTSGSSYGRIEWLNGTPTAAATEAKMKEGIYEGVAELSRSSFRLARVLVPKNATKSTEFYIEDARNWIDTGPWIAMEISSKIEEEVKPPYQQALRVRSESKNTVARLQGQIRVKAGNTLEVGNVIFTLPSSYTPPIENSNSILDSAYIVTTNEVHGIAIYGSGEVKLAGSSNIAEGKVLSFTGKTFGLNRASRS
jgi:hypothetical protein